MQKAKEAKGHKWQHRSIQIVLTLLILAIGIDAGKHVFLKHILQKEIDKSEGIVTVDSLSVSFWPLLQNHIVLKNFKVNVSGFASSSEYVRIRQGWQDWSLAHIQAKEVYSSGAVHVREGEGILDVKDLDHIVKVSALILKDFEVKLPLVSFSGSKASFDFFYKMNEHLLDLTIDAPEMLFPDGFPFGLKGQGQFNTQPPIQGKMDVKIKNIDKILKRLASQGIIDSSQAGLLTQGGDLLGKIGLKDLTLTLKIQNGDVSLGPITLFKLSSP